MTEDSDDYWPSNMCNRCDFEQRKRRAAKDVHVLTTVQDGEWLRVLQDGKPLGVSYMALPDKCDC